MKKNLKKMKAAVKFKPHSFFTQMVSLNGTGIPHIKITQAAYLDMYYIAAESGREEISWLGTVEKVGNTFTIKEVILFEQEVDVAETSLSPADIARVATDLINSGEIDKVNELKFWGHVHPSNSTSPSSQDESQMEVLSNGNDWFIRGIFGREGRAEFTFFDWETGLRFNDVPWELIVSEDEIRGNEIASQVESKVKKIPHTQSYNYFNNSFFNKNIITDPAKNKTEKPWNSQK